jgi:hypothetical protein
MAHTHTPQAALVAGLGLPCLPRWKTAQRMSMHASHAGKVQGRECAHKRPPTEPRRKRTTYLTWNERVPRTRMLGMPALTRLHGLHGLRAREAAERGDVRLCLQGRPKALRAALGQRVLDPHRSAQALLLGMQTGTHVACKGHVGGVWRGGVGESHAVVVVVVVVLLLL